MNPAFANAIIGVLQAVVPAGVTYAVGKGWLTPSDLSFWASVLAGLGFTGWSAGTTTVSK
jgi:hypothetical protein